MCLLRHYFYIHRHQVRFWSSNGLNCFNFLLVRFNLPMIDLWSYRLAARWRRWTVNQYALRAWVRSSSMTSTFLWTPELSSVGTKTDVYLILLVTHQKTCQVTKNWRTNRHAKYWSSSKLNSQVCSWKNWMANVIRFAIKTIRGTDFWKTWDYFLGSFSTNNYRFTTEAI